MKTQQMTVTLDNISLNTIGRARSLAIAGRSCVTCGKRADLFRDSLSVKEYNISGMCQIWSLLRHLRQTRRPFPRLSLCERVQHQRYVPNLSGQSFL